MNGLDEPSDGRRARGQASRSAILDAARSVIVRRGVGALTHRAVAVEAAVPPARVAYHFPTVEHLMVESSSAYLRAFDERLQSATAAAATGRRPLVDACTDYLVDLTTVHRAEFLAAVEVRLALHKRGLVVEEPGPVALIASFGADEARAKAVFAAMFGFAVLAATSPSTVRRAQVRAYVRTILREAP